MYTKQLIEGCSEIEYVRSQNTCIQMLVVLPAQVTFRLCLNLFSSLSPHVNGHNNPYLIMINMRHNVSKMLVPDKKTHVLSNKTSIQDTKSWDSLLYFPCLWRKSFWINLKGRSLANVYRWSRCQWQTSLHSCDSPNYPLDIAKYPEGRGGGQNHSCHKVVVRVTIKR